MRHKLASSGTSCANGSPSLSSALSVYDVPGVVLDAREQIAPLLKHTDTDVQAMARAVFDLLEIALKAMATGDLGDLVVAESDIPESLAIV